MEETFSSLNIKDVEQKTVEGTAEFWDCPWHPSIKEINQVIKNGEKLDLSTFWIFLDHNYEVSTWCCQCRETVFDMDQDEIIKLLEGNTYSFKFFVCSECAQIIKYATFHY
ncbi:unnamed protein product [Meloidogyne enterolobii]|uniref:Uncharacterized protein n=1 Tax=Meloidogyne enterolobii TaxID=390850 RepID=A0ACB0XK45_MELEN